MGKLSKRQSSDISKYEPEKGLKTIAVAEIAEKYFKRAKDADQLFEAISMKLTEQRKYVLWLDTQEKSKGGRGKTRLRSETGLPDRRETHRWRKKLSDPASFEDALNAAKQRCVEICEMAKSAHVTSATGYYEWYTPIEIIEAARATMGGIDVDPATHLDAQKKIKASVCYTVENDGLKQEWPGRVWMNPPYSQPLIEEFCVKLIKEIGEARAIEAITLTNNATETVWGQMLLNASSALCFPAGRVEFWGHAAGSVPLQGQMICYVGSTHIQEFKQHFSQFGVIR